MSGRRRRGQRPFINRRAARKPDNGHRRDHHSGNAESHQGRTAAAMTRVVRSPLRVWGPALGVILTSPVQAWKDSWDRSLILPIFLSKTVKELSFLEHDHHVSRRKQQEDQDIYAYKVDNESDGNDADARAEIPRMTYDFDTLRPAAACPFDAHCVRALGSRSVWQCSSISSIGARARSSSRRGLRRLRSGSNSCRDLHPPAAHGPERATHQRRPPPGAQSNRFESAQPSPPASPRVNDKPKEQPRWKHDGGEDTEDISNAIDHNVTNSAMVVV